MTSSMDNTAQSFTDKWSNQPSLAFSATLDESSEICKWILERNGFDGLAGLAAFLKEKRRVLDAGCGNGRVTALLRRYSSAATTEIVGIDLVAAEIARGNLPCETNVRFRQADLLGDLSDLGFFDFIYCQEVLHHTEDPRRAFLNLCSRLSPGGEIAIYVYKRKAPAREFVDDYVRQRISHLPYSEAMAVCREMTEFGRILAEADVKLTIPGVDVLGIDAGEYTVQRLVYHFFAKCFWNAGLSYEENVAINYDWYHPQRCSRHTLSEVEQWFMDAGVAIHHRSVDFYGVTVRGKRAR